MKIKSLLLTTFMLFTSFIFCQEKKDTIYFDEDWSICEQPIAEYYRVCNLNTDSIFFYKGEVKDYYKDGKLAVSGDYGETGTKNGEFIFYNEKGNITRKGNYLNNNMMGDWYFYDSLGNLKAQFFCKTALDFTPILLIDNNNDTILKNGNGSFSINNVSDYPYILSKFGLIVKGTIHNNVKNGEFKYYSYSKKQLLFTEKYEDGRFVETKMHDIAFNPGWNKDRFFALALSNEQLDKAEAFYHSNMVFGPGEMGMQKLINFIRFKASPRILVKFAIAEKDKICFNIIFKMLIDEFARNSINYIVNDVEDGNKSETLLTTNLNQTGLNLQRKLYGDIKLTIDTSGEVSDCVLKTNLTKDEENKMKYYLLHISGLPVKEDSGKKVNRMMTLQLKTIIDTQKNNSYVVNYTIENSNPFIPDKIKSLNNEIVKNGDVQIEAKFPGGSDAWRMFLERNLNNAVAAQHHAPNGNYTVTVSFMVDENGNISDIQALNDPGYGTVQEVIRVIKKGPKWIPAVKDGKNVIYRQKQNITFQVYN